MYNTLTGLTDPRDPHKEDLTRDFPRSIRVLFASSQADLEIVLNVDRRGVADNKGNPINGDKLIALISAIVLGEHPRTSIVTDARTIIRKHLDVVLLKRTVSLMMVISIVVFAWEYMVVKINFEMVRMKLTGWDKGVGSIIKDLEEPSESIKLGMDGLSEPRYEKEKAVQAIEMFREYVEEGRLEGWKLDLSGNCWVGKECLVNSNVAAAAVDAHMHRFLVASGMDKILDISQIDKYANSGIVG
ncbi:uncharacterized protein LOC125471941 [Pyrus x bretschneideri]|uniref:uncharacterized protein LOC125471941 n=1 Tax=Pyrus x bretschneideri TaxID=225117 RepID=UPI00202E149A|nr:uncharacterized protein LOC125471941 [Pyrus x bretschneideri]